MLQIPFVMHEQIYFDECYNNTFQDLDKGHMSKKRAEQVVCRFDYGLKEQFLSRSWLGS